LSKVFSNQKQSGHKLLQGVKKGQHFFKNQHFSWFCFDPKILFPKKKEKRKKKGIITIEHFKKILGNTVQKFTTNNNTP
jgi:hypothetical protein